jgi:uncharacterized membrane protein
MNRFLLVLVVVVLALMLAGCAASSNSAKNTPAKGNVAGFWLGLWHGLIAPFTFIISLFNKNIGIYEIHNNGNWYNFGFILGVSAAFGGSGRASSRSHN